LEDKIYNLLEKMFNEMNEMRKDVKNNNDQIIEVRKDIKNNSDEIKKVQYNLVRLENDITPKIKSLFDGYTLNTEILHRIEAKLDNLTNKVERQEV